MKVYLVQHGQAKSKKDDPERPLTEKGLHDAHLVAAFIAKSGICPEVRIYHSGKTRAEQTASVFSEYLRPEKDIALQKGLSPKDNPAVWGEQLNLTEEHTMLVGHLPHLGRLASLLLTGDPEKNLLVFKNAGVVCLQRCEGTAWSVCWAVSPELIQGNSVREP